MYNNIQIYLSLKGGRNVFRPKDIFFLDSNTYLHTHISPPLRRGLPPPEKAKNTLGIEKDLFT